MMKSLSHLDRVSSNYSSSRAGPEMSEASDEVVTDPRDMADFASLVR